MKKIDAAVVAIAKRDLEELEKGKEETHQKRWDRERERQKEQARANVIYLLARDDLFAAVSCAFQFGIEDELDDQYLKDYADCVMALNTQVDFSTYETLTKIYTKLGDIISAKRATELGNMRRALEYNSEVFQAMTN
jgi:hypothetical protein